jgi:hypothetical protein
MSDGNGLAEAMFGLGGFRVLKVSANNLLKESSSG